LTSSDNDDFPVSLQKATISAWIPLHTGKTHGMRANPYGAFDFFTQYAQKHITL